MSHHSPSTAPQSHISMPDSQIPPELAERIERFQEATHALLAMYEPAKQDKEDLALMPPSFNGETRCYYLSPGTVQHKQELLKRYHVEDFRGLLAETHMLLAGLVKIMRSTPHKMRVKGYVIASLGCLFEQASALVLRMRNVYDKMEKVSQ